MEYDERDYLQLSGIQHFVFCRRQWALIHVEKLWSDNIRTVEGHHFHKRAHDTRFRERRGDTLTVRGISCSSAKLGVSGQCDVLELHKLGKDQSGVSGIEIHDCEGLWVPCPVEYKKGTSEQIDADRLQLCCQAMCLEEMLCTDVSEGALYYGESRRREQVTFSADLRERVRNNLKEMHQYFDRGYTPKVRPSKSCNACSLRELCLPRLMKTGKVADYISAALLGRSEEGETGEDKNETTA